MGSHILKNDEKVVKVGIVSHTLVDRVENIELAIPEETIKALTDLIDQRIDKRMNEIVKTVNLNETKPLKSLSEEVDPAILEPLNRLIEKAEAKLGRSLKHGDRICEILLEKQNQ